MELKIIIDDRLVHRATRLAKGLKDFRFWLGVAAIGAVVCSGVAMAVTSKPHDFVSGETIVASDFNENFDAIFDAFNARFVEQDLTINVPEDASDIPEAFAALADRMIAHDVTVTIKVSDGVYNMPTELMITHRDGGQLQLIGNEGTPNNVVLNFVGEDGVVVDKNAAIYINGIRLTGDDTDGTAGILARNGGAVVVGDAVSVINFGMGLHAEVGGTIQAEDGVTISSCTEDGVFANTGSIVRALGSTIDGSGQVGIHAANGGRVFCNDCNVTNSGDHGAFAEHAGFIRVQSAMFSGNGSTTVLARHGSFISVNNAVVDGNGHNGVRSESNSTVLGGFVTVNNANLAISCGGRGVVTSFGASFSSVTDPFDPDQGVLGNNRCYIVP